MAGHVLDLLDSREVLDREVKLSEGGPPLTPPKSPKKKLTPQLALRVAREYFEVERLTKRGDFRGALDLVEGWPDRVRDDAGCDFQLLWGFLAYKTANFHEAVNILEPCWEEEGFADKRPALLYYIGRVFYANADFKKAVLALEQWAVRREKDGLPVIPRQRMLVEPASRPATQPASGPASQPASQPTSQPTP